MAVASAMAAAGSGAFIFPMACLLPLLTPNKALGLLRASLLPPTVLTQRQLWILSVTFLALELGSWEPLASLQVEQEQMQSPY